MRVRVRQRSLPIETRERSPMISMRRHFQSPDGDAAWLVRLRPARGVLRPQPNGCSLMLDLVRVHDRTTVGDSDRLHARPTGHPKVGSKLPLDVATWCAEEAP